MQLLGNLKRLKILKKKIEKTKRLDFNFFLFFKIEFL